ITPGRAGFGRRLPPDGINHPGVFGEACVVLVCCRLVAEAAAVFEIQRQQTAQQRRPFRPPRPAKPVLELRALAGLPGGLEAVATLIHAKQQGDALRFGRHGFTSSGLFWSAVGSTALDGLAVSCPCVVSELSKAVLHTALQRATAARSLLDNALA